MTEKESIIYMAQCTLKRELIYIGKTHQNIFEERIKQHENSARKGDSTLFHQALIDYGFKNWEWSIIARCPIGKEIEEEKKLIEKYGAAPIDLLNTTSGQKVKGVGKLFSKEIIERTRGNKFYSSDKTKLGRMFLRQSGKVKPVINLKTKKIFESASEASKLENLPLSTIRSCCTSGKMLSDDTRYAYLDLNDEPILEKGHSINSYIGKRADSKRVKNLINGKEYKNIKEASGAYKLSPSSIGDNANGKYMTLKNKWVFCYLDNDGNEILTESHIKGLNIIRNIDSVKYVAWYVDDIGMKDVYYFKTLDEICEKLNIKSKSHISSVCRGERTHVEKWRFAYFNNDTKQPILTDKHNDKAKRIIRRIICLNDNKKFANGVKAGIHYNLNPSAITKCAAGNAKSVYCNKLRLRFAFLDDNDNPILKEIHNESLSARGKRRIQLLKDGRVFNSLAEYIRETGVPYKTAQRYIKDSTINLFGYEFIELD
jgi:hypothetical protein